ncbi:hypothetical protein CFC21_021300, partial [Triticum aestivum]
CPAAWARRREWHRAAIDEAAALPLHPEPTSPTTRPHHHHYLFSIKQLNTLGAAAVLAFSTTMPLSEIAFGVLLLPYLLLLVTLAFPQRPGKPNPSAPVFRGLAHPPSPRTPWAGSSSAPRSRRCTSTSSMASGPGTTRRSPPRPRTRLCSPRRSSPRGSPPRSRGGSRSPSGLPYRSCTMQAGCSRQGSGSGRRWR